ncbi:MAG: SiaB family protein kinase [Bacteroidales bacterium]|nr:SiaB family protein kinase [Bacteroidales bacterium]
MSGEKFSLYNYHKTFDKDILISFKGPFDKHILAIIGNYIEVILGRNPKAGKKIFKIFIELAQNIAYYSAEGKSNFNTESGIGTLVIGEFDNHYSFVAGNVVKASDIVHIIEKSEIINSLDREGLRQYKREQRNLPQGERGSAHIGLIQVALTAASPLDIEVSPINEEYSFFTISVNVEK